MMAQLLQRQSMEKTRIDASQRKTKTIDKLTVHKCYQLSFHSNCPSPTLQSSNKNKFSQCTGICSAQTACQYHHHLHSRHREQSIKETGKSPIQLHNFSCLTLKQLSMIDSNFFFFVIVIVLALIWMGMKYARLLRDQQSQLPFGAVLQSGLQKF